LRIDVKMPDLSATEGSDILIKRWLVTVGSRVKRGEPLLEVETDKATTEVESAAKGTIAEILAEPEARVAVGEVIARIEAEA
jgi:pyruvate/2-oxoglutarate dehydrogenase complex dihydrolipoamide acyltransferase (E2) component